jgi:tetratricopeptide (TPR) repeat protein
MGARYALIFCFFLAQGGFSADPDGSFAGRLFDKKEYGWARVEYERLLFAFPDSSAAPLWNYRSGRSLMLVGRFEESLQALSSLPAHDELTDSARLHAAICALRLNRVDAARDNLSACRLDFSKVIGAYLDFTARRYSAALDSLKKVPAASPDAFKAQALEKAVTDAARFRKKHYAPALALSLVPGLGHLYTGRKGDAAMTALTVSQGAVVTGYYAYHHSRVRAWTAGAITGLFYAGGMYGAAMSVKIYNRTAARHNRELAERIVFGQ